MTLSYYRPHVPKPPGSFLGYLFTLIIYCCLADHLLLVAKRAVHCRGLTSAHATHRSTPGERIFFFSSLILLFSLPFSPLRLFIQELKVKVYLCLSWHASMALSIYPHGPSVTIPFYHLPSLPAAVEEGEKLMILVTFRGKAANRVAQSSQSACWCA